MTGGSPGNGGRWRAWSILPFVAMIRVYQWTLSPFIGGQCRFYPTCSHYGLEAYRVHGVIRGTALTLSRLLRCQPFSKGGYDPVPLPVDRGEDSAD